MVEKRTAIYTEEMLESMKKVEAARAANTEFEPRRMTAEEKETLLATYHPDYKQSEFRVLEIGVNKGEKVPTELAALLQANSRITADQVDLSKIDYDVDVLIIGGGGAGVSGGASLHPHRAGRSSGFHHSYRQNENPPHNEGERGRYCPIHDRCGNGFQRRQSSRLA